MTDEERAALQEAVDRLNQVLANIYTAHGDAIRIRPFANYDDERLHASVYVQITQGVERIG